MGFLLLAARVVPLTANAETELSTPLRVDQVVALAGDHPGEVLASPARFRTTAERPANVSTLAQPIASPSIDLLFRPPRS